MKKLLLFSIIFITACAGPALTPINKTYPTAPMQIPQDLAAHDWAQTEWWYYTGHLVAENGERYGFELTFFRRRTDEDKYRGIKAVWLTRTAFMSHFSITEEKTGKFIHEGLFRFGDKNVYSATDKYEVQLLDWKASGDDKTHNLAASVKETAINLVCKPAKGPALHGDQGIVPKGQGMANYYMSYTRMEVSGDLVFEGRKMKVTGLAWFDHEYGFMGSKAVDGWDWYSIQLDDNTEYMIYAIRLPDKSIDPISKACKINSDSVEECIPLEESSIVAYGKWVSPETKGVYPSGWRIAVPRWNLDIFVFPSVADQEFLMGDIAYWEGSCRVIGKPANGKAYIELVGYSESEAMNITKGDSK